MIFFPGSNAILLRSSEEPDYLWIMSAVVRSGRALLLPAYKSTYERGDGVTSDPVG